MRWARGQAVMAGAVRVGNWDAPSRLSDARLTGVRGEDRVEDSPDGIVETLQATRVPASVIIIDIDHFKRVNDQRGHYGGDRVLRRMGEILRAHTRNTDGLGRWGGEEFVLVCPGASLEKAAELAEKLRQRIMQTNFIPDDPLPITACLGVAVSHADQGFEDAFRQADEALYLAKSRGRNCVVAAAEDQMHTMTGARKSTWALISGRFKLHK